MVYGHYITTTDGRKVWFSEGCEYCRISTGGQHESNCPYKDIKIAEIREESFRKLGEAWQYLFDH